MTTCECNTNYDTLQFNKTRVGTPFEFKRPAFKAGVSYVETRQADDISNINKRRGTGNREIVRPAFKAPPIKPRTILSFDKLQTMDIEDAGQKVSLSDSSLKAMFDVEVPDVLDTQWLTEKERLSQQYRANGMTQQQIDRELQVNKPLGREQRTITQRRNIGKSELTTADKLKEISEEVKNGNAISRVQQAQITGQLATILDSVSDIDQLTRQQLQDLGENLARIGVPTNYKRLGLIPRFVDNEYYLANAGMINLLLFSKVRESPITNRYNYDLICKNFGNTQSGLPAIKLTSMVSQLSRAQDKRYLDLERGGTINLNQLRAVAGVTPNNFGSSDFDIQPANQ
jgi:hypothetical protein